MSFFTIYIAYIYIYIYIYIFDLNTQTHDLSPIWCKIYIFDLKPKWFYFQTFIGTDG